MNIANRARYYADIPRRWIEQIGSNVWGIVNVSDMLWLRPVPGGLVSADHPFCTGLIPGTGDEVWTRNIVYRSPQRRPAAETDEAIVTRLGRFMARMVACSAAGTSGRGRMPPAINYLHGPVHYNGLWLIFDDFADAIEHASDPHFRAELHRLVARERREPLLVFRTRDYDPDAFAELVCCLRTVLPWFCNSNGPKRRVLWGNPAPYPVVNVITGHWIADTRLLLDPEGRDRVARPPLARRYFRGRYAGWRRRALWPERALARITERRIRARGDRGNLFFVDARAARREREPSRVTARAA